MRPFTIMKPVSGQSPAHQKSCLRFIDIKIVYYYRTRRFLKFPKIFPERKFSSAFLRGSKIFSSAYRVCLQSLLYLQSLLTEFAYRVCFPAKICLAN